MAASDYVDAALDVLGGEDTEFYLTAHVPAKPDGYADRPAVLLNCRYQGCEWGQYVGEMELWEFVTDAREHWETTHKVEPARP